MRILFIGDIVGKPGRRAVAAVLPDLVEERGIELVIANAENAAGGLGATPEILNDLRKLGIHAFTMGNHTWRKKSIVAELERGLDVVRPANYPVGVPGAGSLTVALEDGRKLGLVSVLGRVYMEPFACPFLTADAEIERLKEETNTILVDAHAEATSEKIALGWHLDGKCSAVAGTHTHVQTADEWVMPGGTAYITDVGMCGPILSVIGTDRDRVIGRFLTGMPHDFTVAKGPAQFCAVQIDIDDETGHAVEIERFLMREELEAA